MSDDIIPIHAFFGPDGPLPPGLRESAAAFPGIGMITPSEDWPELATQVQAADVIVGVDRLTAREFIVYGRKTLERIAAGKDGDSEPVTFLKIGVEMEKDVDDLERMIVIVNHLKGSHDYIAYGDTAPQDLAE